SGGSDWSASAARRWTVSVIEAPSEEDDAGSVVGFTELHAHTLGEGGRDVLADVIGANRQLAVSPVDEDCKLHPRRPAVLEQRVDRGPDCAAGEEDVVDEDDRLPFEREVELGAADDGLCVKRWPTRPHEHVVAVEG